MRDKIVEILDENYDASYPLDNYVAGKILELFSEQEQQIKELKDKNNEALQITSLEYSKQIKELEEALKQSLSYLNSFKHFWKEAEEMLNHQLEQALKK